MFSILKLNNPSSPVRANLVCFHWAGGTGVAFKPMAKVLEASNICVYGVSLPGRNGRGTNTMFIDMNDMITALFPEFVKFHTLHSMGGIPLLFFGHSLGGLIAYELVRALGCNEGASKIVVEKVIVSAVRCPADLTSQNKDPKSKFHHMMTNPQLTAYITEIGGLHLNTFCLLFCLLLSHFAHMNSFISTSLPQECRRVWTRRSSR